MRREFSQELAAGDTTRRAQSNPLVWLVVLAAVSLGATSAALAQGYSFATSPTPPQTSQPFDVTVTGLFPSVFVAHPVIEVIPANSQIIVFLQLDCGGPCAGSAVSNTTFTVPALPQGSYEVFVISGAPVAPPMVPGTEPDLVTEFSVDVGVLAPIVGCDADGNCISFSPESPTSSQAIRVRLSVADIPPDACIRALGVAVVGEVIQLFGAYVHCFDVYFPEPPPTFVETLLDPLGAGHYTIQFTLSADPTYPDDSFDYPPITVTTPLDVTFAPPPAFVTPVCQDPLGCIKISPTAPSSIQKVNLSVLVTTGIPSDACISNISTSVVADQILINTVYMPLIYVPCAIPPVGAALPTSVNAVLEPLAAGHYTVQFTASADPRYGDNAFVQGPNGWVQGPVLIANSLDVAAAVGAIPNYSGLWWNAPASSESGWGINLAQQGDTIFATWFTYDVNGKGWWLSMTAAKNPDGSFSGTLYQSSGPPYDAVPFDPTQVVRTSVGTGTLRFTDQRNGTFAYVVNGISQTKSITLDNFGSPPNCTFGVEPNLSLASNYQDVWWAAPAGVESGWGINFAHQGDTIFATWFTYDHDRSPIWLAVTATKVALSTYSGALYRTSGPAFNAVPFSPAAVVRSQVGTATLAIADGNNATLVYTIGAVTQTKAITRATFQLPGTVCQ